METTEVDKNKFII